LYSTEKAIEVAIEAMQSLGGNGYINGISLSLDASAFSLKHKQSIRWGESSGTRGCTLSGLEHKKSAAC
jgi:hypothetical protein